MVEPSKIGAFLDHVMLVIAREARFDRPFCEALLPVFAAKYWHGRTRGGLAGRAGIVAPSPTC
jgi:hypothetical protein